MSHVRADRWYKLGRTLLYGRLEDEAPFQSVRRLVEYEDYTLRRACATSASRPRRRTGSSRSRPSASTCSSPSSSTAREEIGDAEVDDEIIDEGLALDPPALGRRPRAPRHQAGEPAGARRAPPAHRRRLRAGAPVAVAPGRRPRQHDAGPRGAHRRRPRVRARAAATSRPTRSPRRSPPRAAWRARPSCARSMKQDGRDLLAPVPGARAAAAADLAPALEPAPHRCSRCWSSSSSLFGVAGDRGPVHPGPRPRGRRHARPAAPATCMILMAQSVPSATRCRASRRSRPGGSSAASQIDDERARVLARLRRRRRATRSR